MVKRMLIDATHPEETRAVVLDDRYLADFDFETSTKLQLKGNVYLAKITRVEPSLQAAFVEYGGNRHGFLAFSEIHPDYFQVPQADRAILEDLEREAATKPANAEADTESAGDVQPAETITTDADEETADVMADQARRRARLLRSYKIQEVVKRRQIMLVQVVKEERGNKGAALTTYLSLAGRYCVLMPNTPRGGGISRKIVQLDDRRKLKEIAQELEVPQGMGLIIRTAGQERSKAEIKRDYEYLLRLWNEIRETTLKSIAPKMIYEEGDLIKRAMRDLYTRDIEEVLVEGDEGYRSAKRLMTMLMPSRARLVKPYKEETPLFFAYKVEDQLDAMHSPTVQLPAGGSIVIHTTEALTAIDVNSGRSTRERHIDETAVKTNLEAADEVARQLRLRDLAGLIVIDFIDMAEGRHQRLVEKRLRDALKADRARIQMGKISQFGLMELSRQRLRSSLQELSSQVCPHCAGLGVVRSTESCALQSLRAIQEQGIRGEAASLRVALPADVALYVLNQKREALSRLELRYEMRVTVLADAEMVPPAMRIDVMEKRDRERERERTEARVELPAEEPVEVAVEEEEQEEVRNERPAQSGRGTGQRRSGSPVAATPAAAAADEGEEANARRKRKRRRRRRRPSEVGVAPEVMGAIEAAAPDGEAIDSLVPDAPEQPASVDSGAPMVEAEVPAEETVAAEAPAEEPVEAQSAADEPPPAPEPATVEADEIVTATEAEAKPAKPRRVRKPRVPKAKTTIEPLAGDALEELPAAAAAESTQAEFPTVTEDPPASSPPVEADAEPAIAVAPNGAGHATDEQVDLAEPVDGGAEPAGAVTGEDDADLPQRQGWWSRWVR